MTLPDPVTLAAPFFLALIALELVLVRFTGRGQYELKDMSASLAMGLGNAAVKLLPLPFILGAFNLAYAHRLFDLPWAWWVFALCFFAEDFAYYWFHRIAHERRFFWASHVIHHSSQHYNLSTALRQTWSGPIGLTFIFWLPLPLIGFPPAMVFFFSGVSLVYQFWIHTEVIGKLGPLEWVLNTPSHHRVHHATDAKYLDRNHAGVLIIWDRLFGTFQQEEERPNYGVISNIASFNPLRIATHEWVAMGRELLAARSLRAAFGAVLGPPGWASGRTSAAIRAEAQGRARGAAGPVAAE